MAVERKRFGGPRLTHVSPSALITKVFAGHQDARQNVMSGAIAIGGAASKRASRSIGRSSASRGTRRLKRVDFWSGTKCGSLCRFRQSCS